jgi:O-methyltransferase involved in polyketide biosynthesis
MPEFTKPEFSGISEMLLLTLYLRAHESRRPDALIKDDTAEKLVRKLSDDGLYDFTRMESLHLSEENKLVLILRSREFDRRVHTFLARHPQGVVVHIGCGLDTRFERVDNGRVEWYDLDFPHVIELRRQYLGDEGDRYHLLGGSVLADAWLEAVSVHGRRPFLFIAEGVFMYFQGVQVKSLVLRLRDRFPGAELVFDAYSPIHVLRHNLQTSTSKINVRVSWGIWHGKVLEKWGAGIHLLGAWGFFDDPTPRLARIRWARSIDALARTFRIYHFRLGKAAV